MRISSDGPGAMLPLRQQRRVPHLARAHLWRRPHPCGGDAGNTPITGWDAPDQPDCQEAVPYYLLDEGTGELELLLQSNAAWLRG